MIILNSFIQKFYKNIFIAIAILAVNFTFLNVILNDSLFKIFDFNFIGFLILSITVALIISVPDLIFIMSDCFNKGRVKK